MKHGAAHEGDRLHGQQSRHGWPHVAAQQIRARCRRQARRVQTLLAPHLAQAQAQRAKFGIPAECRQHRHQGHHARLHGRSDDDEEQGRWQGAEQIGQPQHQRIGRGPGQPAQRQQHGQRDAGGAHGHADPQGGQRGGGQAQQNVAAQVIGAQPMHGAGRRQHGIHGAAGRRLQPAGAGQQEGQHQQQRCSRAHGGVHGACCARRARRPASTSASKFMANSSSPVASRAPRTSG